MVYLKDKRVQGGLVAAGAFAALIFVWGLMPLSWGEVPVRTFKVERGAGFREIVDQLRDEGLIRSSLVLKVYGLLRGAAPLLKPGLYELTPSMSAPSILKTLAEGALREVQVVIPEGSSIYEVDRALAASGVAGEGELLAYAASRRIEGYLFPDTYNFFLGSSIEEVVDRLLENFNLKARPLLDKDPRRFAENLILASLLEKEVPEYEDQRVVAGVLKKRLEAGMPLQVDATICYIKKMKAGTPTECYPLSPLDFTVPSPYNTYLRVGLPPQPIGSPGIRAISAVLAPYPSRYWYYLSDPKTGKTIFSETLDEQEQNRVKYLKVKR